jgi:hypothetical protein
LDKLVLLKYVAAVSLILFVAFIVLGLALNIEVLTSLGLLLFAVGAGLLTYYLVTIQTK